MLECTSMPVDKIESDVGVLAADMHEVAKFQIRSAQSVSVADKVNRVQRPGGIDEQFEDHLVRGVAIGCRRSAFFDPYAKNLVVTALKRRNLGHRCCRYGIPF